MIFCLNKRWWSQVAVDGSSYHRSCFKCSHGGCVISPSNYIAHEHRLYCRHHHTQLFKQKGNFSQLQATRINGPDSFMATKITSDWPNFMPRDGIRHKKSYTGIRMINFWGAFIFVGNCLLLPCDYICICLYSCWRLRDYIQFLLKIVHFFPAVHVPYFSMLLWFMFSFSVNV